MIVLVVDLVITLLEVLVQVSLVEVEDRVDGGLVLPTFTWKAPEMFRFIAFCRMWTSSNIRRTVNPARSSSGNAVTVP